MLSLLGMLVTKVIGIKTNGQKSFVVVYGAMTEVIRPALYSAYHHITTLYECNALQVSDMTLIDPLNVPTIHE